MAKQFDSTGYPFFPTLRWLAPLGIPALLAYRLRPASFVDAAARIWPIAAIASFLLDEHGLGSSPLHVFVGISIPLAVLIGQGVKSIRWPTGLPRTALALLAVLVLTVPVTVHVLSRTAKYAFPGALQANFLVPDEARALDYVDDQPGPGGVLSDFHIGAAVPAETGRHTYTGNSFWSQPNPSRRATLAYDLTRRWMSPRQARAFVLSTGARYLVSDCSANRSLSRLLGPIIQSAHRFGCARVYTIKPAPDRRPRSAAD